MQTSTESQQQPQDHTQSHAAFRSLQRVRQGLIQYLRALQKSKSKIDSPSIIENSEIWPGELLSFSERGPRADRRRRVDPIGLDGTSDKMFRKAPQAPRERLMNVSAIFVHAGAGYHSTTNEHIHLGACDSAARMAMKVLKAGGSSVDAVEAAIKVLEDKETTNAGYGSNLAIDGVVECDATVVDSLGRSGACGATAQIKNPINLARAILDASNKPLSLRRVPPNLLVGQGATDFAWEQGIPVVPHELLVSKNARDRYVRWREDLRRADGFGGRLTPGSSADSTGADEIDVEYEERVRAKQRRDHTNAIMNGTWNEGQPDSPHHSPHESPGKESGDNCASLRRTPPLHSSRVRTHSPGSPVSSKRSRMYHASDDRRTHSLLGPNSGGDGIKGAPDVGLTRSEALAREYNRPGSDGNSSPPNEQESYFPLIQDYNGEGKETQGSESIIVLPLGLSQEGAAGSLSKPFQPTSNKEIILGREMDADDDKITDTVGAIAIDMYGQIAAGSSSGGIGMKHRGRVGPAALVGIGTAVIPADDADPEGVSVAAVTSGTGEHMATTLASQKCAERLYHNTRRAHGGADIEATEEEAIESFVQVDFMAHPGVSKSNSAGAIGVMAVKKTPYGYFLHFAHNTDSFALASMHSNERDAKCVMSRLGDHGNVVTGGRKIRVD